MAVRVAQTGVSKVITFYKNGDKFFRGYRMAITPRRYRNMETLLNDLTRLLSLPLGARYVLTKTGKTIEDLSEFEHGQGYICSSFPKLKNLRYGVADHLPYWNSSKQSSKGKATQSTKFESVKASPDGVHHRKRSETIKPKIITVIRYGHKPRRTVKVLLNKRTAHTFDQVLDEVTSAIGVWGTNGIRRLYNLSGKRINDVSDLFKEDDCFIAVGNERLQLSDLDDIAKEVNVNTSVTPKTRLPSIGSVEEGDISQTADTSERKYTHKVKSRNSFKLPSIGRKTYEYNTDHAKADMELNDNKKHKRTPYVASKEKRCSVAKVQNSTPHLNSNHIANEQYQNLKDKHKVERKNAHDKEGIAQAEMNNISGDKNSLDPKNLEKKEIKSKQKNVEDIYTLGEKIGDGNFAVVRIGIDKQTKAKVALKIIDKKKIKGKEGMLKDEIRIMKACSHVNIAHLYDTYDTLFDVYLVMELVTGGDLFDEISNSVKFEESIASSFARDIVKALQYLHRQNIVHRDLKPENLLVHPKSNGKKQLKLADFGLAVEVKVPLFMVCGTPTYVAPEILEETGYGLKVDIWAAGVILYIMLCGFPPFRSPSKDQDELFDLIIAGDYEFLSPYWDDVSQKAKDLVKNLLVVDQKQRYAAQQILDHNWLQEEDGVVDENVLDVHSRKPVFNAKRKFKGAAIAVKGSRRLQNLAQGFQFKRGEKLIV